MGIDEFLDNDTEEKKETSTSTDSTNDDNEPSGIEAFMDDDSTPETDNLDRDQSNPWINDFTTSEWNSLETAEKVEYVRKNYDPGYRREVTLAEFNYTVRAIVQCPCGEEVKFHSLAQCDNCERVYSRKGGTKVNLVGEKYPRQ